MPQIDQPVTSSVARQLEEVRQAIADAARSAAREPASVNLIAVSKTHPAERIIPALDAGQRLFGENKIQEAEAKWPALKERYPDAELHLIGGLQTNKVRQAVAIADALHAIDRVKLARAVATEMDKSGRRPVCFVQVNTGAEPQKSGVLPDEADSLIETCRGALGLPIAGLMCLPPAGEEPAPHFAFLREIARRNGLAELSMGMTSDYEAAIQFGATYVRVGTAIFGARDT